MSPPCLLQASVEAVATCLSGMVSKAPSLGVYRLPASGLSYQIQAPRHTPRFSPEFALLPSHKHRRYLSYLPHLRIDAPSQFPPMLLFLKLYLFIYF